MPVPAFRTLAPRSSTGSPRDGGGRWRRLALGLAMVLTLGLAAAPPVSADEYERERAGHPVRIVAYALHPIGVILDFLILRPAHWIGSHEPFQTLFGHTDT